MASENQESTEKTIVLDDSQNSSFTSFKAVDQDGIVIPIQKGNNSFGKVYQILSLDILWLLSRYVNKLTALFKLRG